MDNNDSFLYSYSPFPFAACDVSPEICSTANFTQEAANLVKDQTRPKGQIYMPFFSSQQDRTVISENQLTSACPRCLSQALENGNWCSNCGELLIGASLCSDLSDWSRCSGSFQPLRIARTESVEYSTDLPPGDSTAPSEFLSSYSSVDSGLKINDFTTCHSQPVPMVTVKSSFAPASFVVPPLFTSPVTNADQYECKELPFAVARQTSQAYHVAETNLPLCTQIESLQSTFDGFRLRSGPPVSVGTLQYLSPTAQEYVAPCLGALSAGNPRIASSYPGTFGFVDGNGLRFDSGRQLNNMQLSRIMQQISVGRQRCISGPVKGSRLTVDCVRDLNKSEIVVPSQGFGKDGSFFAPTCTSQMPSAPKPVMWNSSAQNGIGDVYTDFSAPETNCTGKISDRGNLEHFERSLPSRWAQNSGYRAPHLNRFRRKHPSECSRNIAELPVIESVQGSSQRTRSFSHERQLPKSFENQGARIAKPQCRWQSSRIAWSAHDPCLLRKKPASCFRTHPSNATEWSMEYGTDQSQRFIQGNSQVLPSTSGPLRPISRSAQPKLRNDYQSRATLPSEVCGEKRSRKGRNRHIKRNRASASENASATPHLNPPNSQSRGFNLPSEIQPADILQTQANTGLPAKTNEDRVSGPAWMQLPDELWLAVFRSLELPDRAKVARVCRRFSELILDRSLWRVIQLHRRQCLKDADLAAIGRLRPRELRLMNCRGDSIGEKGLKQMFQFCGLGLRKLAFISCTKGPFDLDLPLLLAAKHCPNLSHINASYTQSVRDHTVIALAKSALHLVSVKLNGAQQISNSAIQQLVHYHKNTLQRLELFGCFRLNSDIFTLLGSCQELRALAFGHLYRLSSEGLLELVGKLPHLASLDLRGTQTLANDSNLPCLADKCPHLEEVVLANMQSLRCETGIAQMLGRLPRLRVLDLCGLVAVGDLTMEALATGCPHLEELDVSSTSVTYKGLSCITTIPAKCLRCLRISHCRDITKEVLEKLVRACVKLTQLHAYGFKSIDDWSFLQVIRPALLVETD
ncbi:unnamed protein product [Calicophoron daubneyi]|uniref:F-box domain-containing protein n=1 Tax=Calicophoron daubneyi TaxID=300641 RepID=A0AAV2TUE4_CALDB